MVSHCIVQIPYRYVVTVYNNTNLNVSVSILNFCPILFKAFSLISSDIFILFIFYFKRTQSSASISQFVAVYTPLISSFVTILMCGSIAKSLLPCIKTMRLLPLQLALLIVAPCFNNFNASEKPIYVCLYEPHLSHTARLTIF